MDGISTIQKKSFKDRLIWNTLYELNLHHGNNVFMVLKTSYTTYMSTANFDLFSWQFLLLVLILCDVIQTLHNIMFSNRMYPMSVGKSQELMKNMSCVIPILLWYEFYMLIL